jgi:hypothetical protein
MKVSENTMLARIFGATKQDGATGPRKITQQELHIICALP